MSDASTPWFADQAGAIFVFRVNRRPKEDLFTAAHGIPDNVFEHFVRVLAPGFEVVTGRRHQRTWKVGGIDQTADAELLTAKLGWLPLGEAIVPNWSEEEQDWVSSVSAPQGGQVMPFGFDGESRLLAVLHDHSSAPMTIALVLERVLQRNEEELEHPTVDWAVEPVLDAREFVSWLHGLDIVRSVSFTARLPNPEPDDDFDELFKRLSGSRATEITETVKSSREEGLVEVQRDRDVRQAIAMGHRGFATLRGRGIKDGRRSAYSQKDQVARERVDNLPVTWSQMRDLLGDLLRDKLRRFLGDGEDKAA